MTAITFDTLQFAKRMRTLGMTDSQAELFAEAMKEAITSAIESLLATKNDLGELELRLTKLISDTRSDIIKWVAAMLLAQAAVIAALVKLL
ncbi:MAG: hypothetical protein A2511_17280 [Deltaproteobacteria bacterium RIFOXYD12_FULL_50_9]|nr:MAG: hypothetical protein A2511_17280 [Deltaproteobacteria bacterium RIFOXYD12_FULL_50_9]